MLKRPLTVQPFTLTASSQMSAKVGTETYRVRVAVGSTGTGLIGAYILFGDSTALTATSTNSSFIPANWVDEFDVTPGQSFALIEPSTHHATVTVTEMS